MAADGRKRSSISSGRRKLGLALLIVSVILAVGFGWFIPAIVVFVIALVVGGGNWWGGPGPIVP